MGHGSGFSIGFTTVGGRTVVIGTGALLAAGLALGACGGTAFSMVRAYGDTVSARTAKMTFSATITVPGPSTAGATIHLIGSGVTDLGTRTAELTADVPGAGPIEERMVNGTMYMHLPYTTTASGLPPGKTWVSMNFSELCGNSSALANTGIADPTSVLGQFRAASTSGLQDLGSARVDGVDTTHYRATLDPAKAAKAQCSGGPLSSVIAKQAARMHAAPADVWVDSADRIRQMKMSLDLPVGDATGRMDMTVGFSDFGVPVNVVAPTPAETIDATQLPGFNQALQKAGNG